MKRRRFRTSWLSLGAALLLLLVLLAACASKQAPVSGPDLPVASAADVDNSGATLAMGDMAPDFALQYANGEISRLSDWRGRPVVVNFWATWCAPCRAEMPEFVKAYGEHADAGLVILGVNEQESAEKAQAFMEEFQIGFPVTLDSRGEIQRLYQVRGLPTTFFIDREGRLVGQWAGLLTGKALQEFLSDIL